MELSTDGEGRMTPAQSLLAPGIFLGICFVLGMTILLRRSQVAMIVCGILSFVGMLASCKLLGWLAFSWLWILSPAWIAILAYAIGVLYWLAVWAWNYR